MLKAAESRRFFLFPWYYILAIPLSGKTVRYTRSFTVLESFSPSRRNLIAFRPCLTVRLAPSDRTGLAEAERRSHPSKSTRHSYRSQNPPMICGTRRGGELYTAIVLPSSSLINKPGSILNKLKKNGSFLDFPRFYWASSSYTV